MASKLNGRSLPSTRSQPSAPPGSVQSIIHSSSFRTALPYSQPGPAAHSSRHRARQRHQGRLLFEGLTFFIQNPPGFQMDDEHEILLNQLSYHGGKLAVSPLLRSVTHIIVKLPSKTPRHTIVPLSHDQVQPENTSPADLAVHGWGLYELLSKFGLVDAGPTQRAVLVRAEWVRKCVELERIIGEEEDWGGWRVYGAITEGSNKATAKPPSSESPPSSSHATSTHTAKFRPFPEYSDFYHSEIPTRDTWAQQRCTKQSCGRLHPPNSESSPREFSVLSRAILPSLKKRRRDKSPPGDKESYSSKSTGIILPQIGDCKPVRAGHSLPPLSQILSSLPTTSQISTAYQRP